MSGHLSGHEAAMLNAQMPRTRYATPALRRHELGHWVVVAQPWNEAVGITQKVAAGWTAVTHANRYAGLWPTKQAAAEVLVKQAGYELEMS